MENFKTIIVQNKAILAFLTAIVLIAATTFGVISYRERMNDSTISSAKNYLKSRDSMSNQFAKINYVDTVNDEKASLSVIKADCAKLKAFAAEVKNVDGFDNKDRAKDNKYVKEALAKESKYSIAEVAGDAKSLASVCDQHAHVTKFVDDMNAKAEQIAPDSKEFYEFSQKQYSSSAKYLGKECPFAHLNKSQGQKICDKQVSDLVISAKAYQIILDALKNGQSSRSVEGEVLTILEPTEKDLKPSVYTAVLGEPANRDNLLQKFVAKMYDRIENL